MNPYPYLALDHLRSFDFVWVFAIISDISDKSDKYLMIYLITGNSYSMNMNPNG